MARCFAFGVALTMLLGGRAAFAQKLGVGSVAPPIQVKQFVKGEPVKSFEKGKIYVVEFWATWCGPCRVSIPHLTELQKKHSQVTFIGVSVWEQDQSSVAPFVKEMGDRMAYRVAIDLVPLGMDADAGRMAVTWMKAAGQDGIPAAFIVNGEGKIAWIGHPMEMDRPLEQIVAGKWDLKAAVTEQKKAADQRAKLQGLQQKLAQAQQTGGLKGVLKVIDETLAADPDLEGFLGMGKFSLMRQTGAPEEAVLAYGEKLAGGSQKDNAQALNGIAWMLIDPDAGGDRPSPAVVKFALKTATRADVLAGSKDPAILDTLARAVFLNGDAVKALTLQEKAMELAKGTPVADDPGVKARLEQYRKAANK